MFLERRLYMSNFFFTASSWHRYTFLPSFIHDCCCLTLTSQFIKTAAEHSGACERCLLTSIYKSVETRAGDIKTFNINSWRVAAFTSLRFLLFRRLHPGPAEIWWCGATSSPDWELTPTYIAHVQLVHQQVLVVADGHFQQLRALPQPSWIER